MYWLVEDILDVSFGTIYIGRIYDFYVKFLYYIRSIFQFDTVASNM